VNDWQDTDSIEKVQVIRENSKKNQLPALVALAGEDSAAYSSEADVLEENFAQTFFGDNYARLSKIKKAVDPKDLFIVSAGVGSERWDVHGICQV
jgi:hypothetical protein